MRTAGHGRYFLVMLMGDCLVTDRVRSTRESNVFSLFTPGGGTPARSRRGVYPSQVQVGGGYLDGGYPTSDTPLSRTWPEGYPGRGVPHLGYPPSDLVWGYPSRGVPHLGYPSIRPGRGVPHLGYPPIKPGWGGYPTE